MKVPSPIQVFIEILGAKIDISEHLNSILANIKDVDGNLYFCIDEDTELSVFNHPPQNHMDCWMVNIQKPNDNVLTMKYIDDLTWDFDDEWRQTLTVIPYELVRSHAVKPESAEHKAMYDALKAAKFNVLGHHNGPEFIVDLGNDSATPSDLGWHLGRAIDTPYTDKVNAIFVFMGLTTNYNPIVNVELSSDNKKVRIINGPHKGKEGVVEYVCTEGQFPSVMIKLKDCTRHLFDIQDFEDIAVRLGQPKS